MGIFNRLRSDHIRVHVLIRGIIGDAWRDVGLRVPAGTTLGKLVDVSSLPLRDALDTRRTSPTR